MEVRYPDYYRKFRCIAGDCPDTCCAGWEISVDAASEKRYREICKNNTLSNKVLLQKMKKHIKHGRIISEGATCPFLNQDRLCELYIELGPEALCHTCARHPRHLEDYGNLQEIVLLLSCPEVARLVLEENDGGFYVRQFPERQGNMEGIDEELLKCLLKAREVIWKWNADKTMPVDKAMALSMALAHDLQRRLEKQDHTGMQSVLSRYDRPETAEVFQQQWKVKNGGENAEGKEPVRFLLMSDFMEECSELEIICRDWPELLERCRGPLYHAKNSRHTYSAKHGYLSDIRPEAEKDKEKLFAYFIYSFVLSALYDGELLTKVKMAVLCTMAVEELYMVAERWSLKERAFICHAIARQIENCDENRVQLEKILKQEQFCSRRIIDTLLELEG